MATPGSDTPRPRRSPAVLVAILALVAALGGTALAGSGPTVHTAGKAAKALKKAKKALKKSKQNTAAIADIALVPGPKGDKGEAGAPGTPGTDVQLRTQAEATPTAIPATGQFVELAELQVPDGADELLVTPFVELNGKTCQTPVDVTARVLFDGQAVAEYPAMTSTVTPGTYIQPGLGGLVDVYAYAQSNGTEAVTLELAAAANQSNCVTAEDRNINAVIVSD